MQLQATATIFLLAALLALTSTTLVSAKSSSSGYNITKILASHPSLTTFNHYLTATHLADEINRRQTITVCALDNSAMSDIVSKGYSLYTIRNILSFHVLVDYYGTKKLHQITDGTTLTASLFQSTGAAPGNSGYVNITDLGGGKVGFCPSENDGDFNSFYVKSILENPYSLSVIEISQPLISSAEAAAPTPSPSSLDDLTSLDDLPSLDDLTSLLSSKGCKTFSSLVTSTGADTIFQANMDGGLTVFCFGDAVFKSCMPKYKNLTDVGKTALILYHGLPYYNSMGMMKANNGDVHTLATDGKSGYWLTVKNDGDAVMIKTKIVTARVTGTCHDDNPLAIYKIDKVLLPKELFETMADEPTPAPEAELSVPGTPDSSDDESEDDESSSKKNGAAGWKAARDTTLLVKWWHLFKGIAI